MRPTGGEDKRALGNGTALGRRQGPPTRQRPQARQDVLREKGLTAADRAWGVRVRGQQYRTLAGAASEISSNAVKDGAE